MLYNAFEEVKYVNERIKAVRLAQNPKMSQDAFGAKIGITGAAVSRIESGDRNVTDQVIVSICREFGVSEEWLRTGQGEMFVQISPDEELDYILGQIGAGADETIVRIIRAYWKLDEKEKAAVRKLIDNLTEQ